MTGQFNSVRGIALDAQGNVYVADAGNKRIQVFDGDGNFKSQITGIGAPAAICISPGPKQILYSSNSNPPEDIDSNGEIYKLDLSGQVLGKFGEGGQAPERVQCGQCNRLPPGKRTLCRGNRQLEGSEADIAFPVAASSPICNFIF